MCFSSRNNVSATPARITDEVIGLYQRHRADDYISEPVSQLEHMGQSAQLTERDPLFTLSIHY